MMTETDCIICGAKTSIRAGRCTNACCAACHAKFCTPDGETSPGHCLNVPEARASVKALRPYHVECSVNGHVSKHAVPKGKAVDEFARNNFSHTRCDWVRICDWQGPVRYVSHTGQMCP